MSAVLDRIDAAPFDLGFEPPERVFVWAEDGKAATVKLFAADKVRFVLASHDAPTIARIMAKLMHKPGSQACPGEPVGMALKDLEEKIRAYIDPTVAGWTLRDEHGEVARRYCR